MERDKIIQIGINEGEIEFHDDDAMHDKYNEMLNEVYPTPSVAGCEMAPADFLEQNDPTMYRCGFPDFTDSEGTEDFNGGYIYTSEADDFVDNYEEEDEEDEEDKDEV